MQQQTWRMTSQVCLLRALCYLLFVTGLLEASPLLRVKNPRVNQLNIDSSQANDFLTNSRPKRNVDPKWYRGNPDFQSYYRFYNSIGHIEGLYEIDRIRMLYHQMRHLEMTYGPDASSYQSLMGVQTTAAPPPPPTTQLPTTPAPTPDPLESAQTYYLCNKKDPLCKPQIVYMPTGAVPVLCDPRVNPACRPRTEAEVKAAAAAAPPPPPPPPPPAPKKSAPPPPPPPPAITAKGMEFDCDPYWDPDCLIDHPPRPILETPAPPAQTAPPPPPAAVEEKVVKEEPAKAEESAPEAPKTPNLSYAPYDFRSDLFDPFRYANPAPEE